MNTKDLIYLLNKPAAINETQTTELETVLAEFPFLQSARALHLKGLYNQDSFRYNSELKKTAAYTTDRSVLFDFITSDDFVSLQQPYFDEEEKKTGDISVAGAEVVTTPINALTDLAKLTIKETQDVGKITESNEISIHNTDDINQEIQETVPPEIKGNEPGRPLDFVKSEKHSFQEWLQLSRLAPIVRETETAPAELQEELLPVTQLEEPKSRNSEMIDKFIETNPKIVPVRNAPLPSVNINASSQDTSYLMTETLARVYLEQKKYQKAIQAYEILILKYPEKSVFFADRISDIKTLQQNNN